MGLGAGIALGQQPRGQFGHHIAVLGMHHRDAAQIADPAEGREQLVVIHHQRALVGHEMLEAGDAPVHDRLHLIENLLPPPRHRHVIAVIAMRAARLVVPHLQRIQQALTRRRQGEIHHHRRPARQRGPRPALEIIGGIGAHEGHLQMRMRVDPARHDQTAAGIQNRITDQPLTDGRDPAPLDQHIRRIAQIRRDDRAASDDRAHRIPLLHSNILGVRG